MSGRAQGWGVGTALLLAASLAVSLVACGGGGGGSAQTDGEEDGTPPVRPTATTQPVASDPEAVRPHLEALIERHDELRNRILADLSLAKDPDSEVVQEYLDLFEPDSERGERALELWGDSADAGRTVEPTDPAAPPIQTRVDGPIIAGSDELVTVPTCEDHSYRYVDESGAVIDEAEHEEQRGEVVAVWVYGEWLLQEHRVFSNTSGCATRRSEG